MPEPVVEPQSVESSPQSGWAKRRAVVTRRIEIATLNLCLQNGVDGVTVDDIALAAHISRRTFYRYFGTIDDVLTASPKRALERISAGVRARPASENVREAFVNSAFEWGYIEEEREIQAIASMLVKRDPVAWSKAIDRIRPTGYEVYEKFVAERLRMSGEDSNLSPLIAQILFCVTIHVAKRSQEEGRFPPSPDELESAFGAVTQILQI